MVAKKRKCSNVRGYACGKTCISRLFVCRKELSNQAIQIASGLVQAIKSVSKPALDISNYDNLAKANEPVIAKFSEDWNKHRKTGQKLDKFIEVHSGKLKDADKSWWALRDYAGAKSKEIKKSQYNGGSEWNEHIDAINDVVNNSQPAEGPVFSGMNKGMAQMLGLDKIEPGEIWDNKTFNSFSYNLDTAQLYAQDNDGVVLVVEKAEKGADMRYVSSFVGEYEYMMPAVKYIVEDVVQEADEPKRILVKEYYD